jgi:hypothetical protein
VVLVEELDGKGRAVAAVETKRAAGPGVVLHDRTRRDKSADPTLADLTRVGLVPAGLRTTTLNPQPWLTPVTSNVRVNAGRRHLHKEVTSAGFGELARQPSSIPR